MTNVNQDDQPNVDDQDNASSGSSGSSGLPLRGFAMVLIAVAVMLGLWGLYALTQGEDDTTASNGDTSVTAEGTGGEGAQGAEGDSGDDAAGAEGQESAEGAEQGSEGAESDDADAASGSGSGDSDEAGAAGSSDEAQASAAGTRSGSNGASTSDATTAKPKVNVLNNSTVNGLAESIYNELGDRGNDMGVHGNLADEVVILQETTVYYEEGDAAGEAAATELAEQIADTNGVNVTTEPNIDGLPDDVTGEGAITLALIGEVIIP